MTFQLFPRDDIDEQPNDGAPLMRDGYEDAPAELQDAGNCGGCGRDQTAVARGEVYAVVCDELCAVTAMPTSSVVGIVCV